MEGVLAVAVAAAAVVLVVAAEYGMVSTVKLLDSQVKMMRLLLLVLLRGFHLETPHHFETFALLHIPHSDKTSQNCVNFLSLLLGNQLVAAAFLRKASDYRRFASPRRHFDFFLLVGHRCPGVGEAVGPRGRLEPVSTLYVLVAAGSGAQVGYDLLCFNVTGRYELVHRSDILHLMVQSSPLDGPMSPTDVPISPMVQSYPMNN